MGSSKREKAVIANWIARLLKENQFVAFTRTPKGVTEQKELQRFNKVAIDRLTIKDKTKW